MIKHKDVHNYIILIVVLTILICIGGIFTGLVTQSYEDLKNNPKIESEIIDQLQEKGSAEVIVELKSSSGNRKIQLDVPEFEINYEYSNINAISGKLDKKTLKLLSENSQVEKIYFNKIYKINLDESIPLINADEVHEVKRSNVELKGNGYSVCVIDTGVDYNHPALVGRVILGYDYVNNDSDPMDDNSHGTHVAGIIASNDTTYTGIAPEAKIVAVKSCDSNGDCAQADILAGIDWCISNASLHNITVISLSLGDDGEYNETTCPSDFNSSINNAVSNNIFVTISSGNNGHESGISSPSCSANATSVGATDKLDNIWGGSNIGEDLDLFAPGITIQSSILGSSFGEKSGTSMANAHVAGAALLIYQNRNLSGESITPLEIRDQLKNNGFNINSNGFNISRIDVKDAVLMSKIELSYEINPYPKTNANISFNANYTNKTSNSSITSATCKINFTDSQNNLMNWNASIDVYQYIRNFTSPATYSYNVTCNHSSFETLIETSNIEVVQGSENCTYPGSNIDWNLTGSDFSRCVGETLIINQSNINIKDNAEFILRDTNLTLVGASTHYIINVSSGANFTLNNALIKGMDQTTKRLDVEIHGGGDIYNSTFENSRLRLLGNKSHEIENSTFTYLTYFEENSNNNIINSNFTNYLYFYDDSINKIENSSFSNLIYINDNVNIESKNSNFSGLIRIYDSSIFNFTGRVSNLTNEIRTYNSPKIYGGVDMPSLGSINTGNLTRYYPVYVYYNDRTTPYPNREVIINDSNGNLILQGITNSQGYIEMSLILNTTNFGSGNFTISTNSSSDIFLLTDTPIILQSSESPPIGEIPGGGGGSGSTPCTEDWNCTSWGACINSVRNRNCIDLNDCGTEENKPNETRICFSSGNANNGNSEEEERSYHIAAGIETGGSGEKDCCLIGICWFRYIICWYWWLLILIVIIVDIIVIWKIKAKKKKRRQKALIKAFGIDWVLKHSHLNKKRKHKKRKS